MRRKKKKEYFGILVAPKEYQTWKMVAKGLSTKQIAKRRKVSIRTIDSVRSVLMAKLGAHRAAELIAMWYQKQKK